MGSRATVRVEAERPATRCALCHDGLAGGRVCLDCGTVTHPECAAEAGGCPTLGCAPRRELLDGVADALRARRRPAAARPRRALGAGQLGLLAGTASLLLGVAAGAVATGCPGHALLGGGGLLVLALSYALLGAATSSLCRLLERWRHAGPVDVRPLSWPYVPLLLVAGAGAVFAFVLVVGLDALHHARMW